MPALNAKLDLNTCTVNLIDNLHKLCNKHAPITKSSNRKLKYCNKPWIDKELLELIKHKNNLFRKKKNYPCDFNNSEFSKIRNKVNHETRKKKKLYYSKYFNEYRNNSKKTWEGLYSAMEMTKSKKLITLNITDKSTGIKYNQEKTIANQFAKYFQEVPINARKNIPTEKCNFKDYLPNSKTNSMYFYETNPSEVSNMINKLNDHSSTGDIDIPNQFLKILSFPLSYLISYIANRSLSTGYVPDTLKTGKQTPVFKSGENYFSNYRPITVCNSISKIIERLAGNRLIEYLDSNNNNNNINFSTYI